MSLTPTRINESLSFDKKYTFCTLVTRYDEYLEMVESAKNAGFDTEDIEYLYFDNQVTNQIDGFEAVNRALKEAKGEYLIFCHQDILFKFDRRSVLDQRLIELENKDKNWVLAGNAGKSPHGKAASRITDPNSIDCAKNVENMPFLVESLDENFIVINRKHQIATSSAALKGFHLYALDLCQNAKYLGLNAYVINFHLLHKSGGNVDSSYFKAQDNYTDLIRKRRQFAYLPAVCFTFFATPFKWINKFNKNPRAIKYFRSIVKRIDKAAK